MTAFAAGVVTGLASFLVGSTVVLAFTQARYAARRERMHRERARARDFAARWS